MRRIRLVHMLMMVSNAFSYILVSMLKVLFKELDRAYRYWGYVEHHPAHAPLPEGAYSEALDFVEWSYTGA